MFRKVVALVCALFAFSLSSPLPVKAAVNYDPMENFMYAVARVETGLTPDVTKNFIDVNGRALGAFCIHFNYWKDGSADSAVPKIWPDGITPYMWADCADLNIGYWYSTLIFRGYMKRYAKDAYYADPDISYGKWQVMSRIHNGGPNGMNVDATLAYWFKVKNMLYRQGWTDAPRGGLRPPVE